MRPNIARNGRIARAITGSLCIALGVVVWLIGWPESFAFRCLLSVVSVAAGGFQLFEARRGWCIMRACGFKTPM